MYIYISVIHLHLTSLLMYEEIKVIFYLPCSICNYVLPVCFYIGLILIPLVNICCVLHYDIVFVFRKYSL